jgi:hypothetical protein
LGKIKRRNLRDVEKLAVLLEEMPESQLWEDFVLPKYGITFRNLLGLFEHAHYHLGQIALLKKL